jgi:transposase
MKHYAGLDASVKETSMCIIDEAGKTTRETKVASEPEVILAVLMDEALTMRSRPSGVRRAFLWMSIRLS